MKRALLILALLPALALAEPPAAPHPTPGEAGAALGLPTQPGHEGRVLEAIDTTQYTYVKVAEGSREYWIAAPRIELMKGALIRFPDGAVMTRFHSRVLDRTFDSIMFVSKVSKAGNEL